MCLKGLATPDMMYHPDRLLYPLKRSGKRQGGKWNRISWDRAISEISERILAIRSDSGPESIALGQGTGRHHFMHLIRFANSLGTPNWYEPGLANCFIPRISVCNLTYGGFVSADYYGNVNPKTILFWGHNPLVTGADGELAYPVERALKKGSYGIAIDPRRSETARRCRMWLPLRPGTDCALALAMIHVIIQDDIYDRSFVETSTTGFGKLKQHVKGHTPGWAQTVTGVPARQIIAAARRYALEKPSVLEWGVAVEQTPNALQTVRALALLRGITGNIDCPGSDVFGKNPLRPYPLLKEALPREAAKKRLGAADFKLLGGFRAYMPSAHIPAVFKAMRFGEPYPVRALLNFGSNPLATIANANTVYESLKKLDLLVVADLFMTPTAAMADYVLPAAFWPELDQIVEIPYVAGHGIMAQQKAVAVGQCLPDEEILIRLARKLNLPGADDSLTDILDHRLEPLGITFEALKRKGWILNRPDYGMARQQGFRTPTKKVELYSNALRRMGFAPLPVYTEPPESPVSTKKLHRTYPFVLTTGARRKEFFHSEQRQISRLRKKRPWPVAEIHPRDAEEKDIGNGDTIYVSSPRGKIRVKAVVTEDIMQGVINVDHGWWFPEKEDLGIWESNVNLLTSDAPPYDWAFGSYQLRALLCTIEKAV